MKKFLTLSLVAATMLGFTACDNDDNNDPQNPEVAQNYNNGIFVLNQGNYYSQLEGSLSYYDYSTKKVLPSLFQTVNGISLGSSPQAAAIDDDYIYMGIYESNVIQIVDRKTLKSVKMISLAEEEGQGPRSLIAKDGKVYISMFNGYVSRLDKKSLTIDKTVKVGPNPEIMAIQGKYLYVPNSDGMNWEVGYGTTASKINLDNFTVESTLTVGLNPAQFESNGKDLFLLCKGDYYEVPSKIYRLKDDNTMEEIAEATYFAVNGNNVYYINSPWGAPEFEYSVYNITDGSKTRMVADEGVDAPSAIAVDPTNGNIVIASNSMDNGFPSYTIDGYAKVYDSKGNLIDKFTTGISPSAIFFAHK